MLCLALAGLLPSSGSALTLADLTGTVAASSYSPVTVTSAANKTITITATPLSYNNSQWTYQIAWNRAKNAQGSLYISPKSNASTKVVSISPADRAGSSSVVLQPSTAYRVEFYSSPNAKGSLLVRKYFTTRQADLSQAFMLNSGSAGSTYYNNNSTYSGLSGNLNAATGNSAVSSTGTTGQAPASYMSAVTMAQWSCGSDGTHCMDKYGTQVGPGIGANLYANGSCSPDRITGAGVAQGGTGNPTSNVGPGLACKVLNKNFVAAIDYTDGGKCFHVDDTGTYQVDCGIMKAMTGSIPPPLPSGFSLNSILNASFDANTGGTSVDWGQYHAECSQVKWNGQNGYVNGILCGGPGATVPTKQQLVDAINQQSAGINNGSSLLYNAQITLGVDQGRAINQYGTQVGPGIGANLSANPACNPDAINGAGVTQGGTGNPASNVGPGLACKVLNKNFIAQMWYSDASGQCHHLDDTGDYVMDQAICKWANGGHVPPQLPAGYSLASIINASFDANTGGTSVDWGQYGAQCSQVKWNGTSGYVNGILCGGPGATRPTTQQLIDAYKQQAAGINNGSSILSNAQITLGVDQGRAIDQYGTQVGPGIGANLYSASGCNPDNINGAGVTQGGTGNPASNVGPGLACKVVNKNFIAQMWYSDSQGRCHHLDDNGDFVLDNAICTGVLGHMPPQLPAGYSLASIINASFDANTGGTSVDWNQYGAQCSQVKWNGQTGYVNGILCGGPGATVPTTQQLITAINQQAAGVNNGSGILNNAIHIQDDQGRGINMYGSQVGPGIGQNLYSNSSCNPDNIIGAGDPNGGNGGNPASNVGPGLACKVLNKNFIAQMWYTDASGQCHHLDDTGDYVFDASICKWANGGKLPPQLPSGYSLSSIVNASFDANTTGNSVDWSQYGAQCSQVRWNGSSGYVNGILCGGPGATQPTTSQVQSGANATQSGTMPAGCLPGMVMSPFGQPCNSSGSGTGSTGYSGIVPGTRIQCTSDAMCGSNKCMGATATMAGSCTYQP